MGAIGSAIDSAIGMVMGSEGQGSNLQNFLSKFSSSAGKYIDTLDPLATFEVSFLFSPPSPVQQAAAGNKDWLDGIADRMGGALKSMGDNLARSADNLLNNVTGGLFSSIVNDVDIQKEHDSFTGAGKNTFMEYLAKANLLVGHDMVLANALGYGQSASSPLELNLGPYIQKITVPNMQIVEDKTGNTLFGDFPVSGPCVIPDSHQLQLEVLNTKAALHERIFYPWLKETTLPYWSYDSQPYTTATVTIDFSKHSPMKYVFTGCRPSKVETRQPTQQPDGGITRNVTILFDFMFIESDLQTVEKWQNKLMSTGRTLLNSAAHSLNI